MTAAYQSAANNAVPSATLFVISGIALVIAILLIVAMWRVFTKAGRPGWAAIVPFYNAYVLLKIVGRPGWWLVLLLLPVVNVVFGIIVAIDVARAFGRGPAFGVLLLFLFSPIGYLILGFGNAAYRGPDGSAEPAEDERDRVGEPNYVVLAGVALTVVAAFAAVWFGVSWAVAANDDSLSRAKARDEVDRVGRQAILTFNTLDYRKVDEGLDAWQNAATGALRDDIIGRRDSSKQMITEAKAVTKADVLSLAVTELNEFEGKATVVAAIATEVQPEGKPSENKYQRILAGLDRTPDGWKLSAIQVILPAQG